MRVCSMHSGEEMFNRSKSLMKLRENAIDEAYNSMKAASSQKDSCNGNACTSQECENLPMQEVESFIEEVSESPILEVVNSKEHQDTAFITPNNWLTANVIDSTCDPLALEAAIICERNYNISNFDLPIE
ncbi:uncharacterized protein LOC117173584 [Belonocnema kinseyi]|uniref:uncharacterized protein LOC117173584 n=1 Tax=Belonocnema kinseyi TaxID=2817044 RepID=UPI00143CF91A|nr:uncharacterized protein LOC117173584 [Belonocnema kinseyi]